MHQAAFNATKFFVLSSSLFVVVGCNAGAVAEKISAEKKTKPKMEIAVPLPPTTESLALLSGAEQVRVGDIEEEVLANYPRPKGAKDFLEEVPISADGVKARGWEKNGDSFALMSKDGRVILAMETFEKVPAELSADLSNRLYKRFGPPTFISKKDVEYKFWTDLDRGENLMTCLSSTSEGTKSFTMAVGTTDVMTALRMDPKSAEFDAERAQKQLDEVFSQKGN